MKKNILLLTLALSGTMTSMAQLNGTGYYRLKNVATGKYISFANNKFDYQTIIATAGNGARHLFNFSFFGSQIADDYGVPAALSCTAAYLKTDIHMVGADSDSPSTILYLKNSSGNNYDIQAQSTGLIQLTTGTYSTSNITATFENIYAEIKEVRNSNPKKYYANVPMKGTGKYSFLSQTITIGTEYFMDDGENFNILDGASYSSSRTDAQWYIEPVNADNPFEVNPRALKDGKYYTTYYTAFPYTISGNLEKAYVVSDVDIDNGVVTLTALSGTTVPACTPVILECGSQTGNYIIPTGTPTVVATGTSPASSYSGQNYLEGTFFCNTDGNMYYDKYNGSTVGTQGTTTTNGKYFSATNVVSNDQSTMRVMGIVNGMANFYKLSTNVATMGANKAWLDLSGLAASANSVNRFSVNFNGVSDFNEDEEVFVSEDGGFPDGIDAIMNGTSPVVVYDLQGRKVSSSHLTKGIYVVNGKKVYIGR